MDRYFLCLFCVSAVIVMSLFKALHYYFHHHTSSIVIHHCKYIHTTHTYIFSQRFLSTSMITVYKDII